MANNFENAKSELKQIEYIKENHGLWSEEAKACYIAIREYYRKDAEKNPSMIPVYQPLLKKSDELRADMEARSKEFRERNNEDDDDVGDVT